MNTPVIYTCQAFILIFPITWKQIEKQILYLKLNYDPWFQQFLLYSRDQKA